MWSPNEGYRVAYRSGDQLRVIWGDGTNDAAIGGAAGVAAAWQPRTGSRNVLAYADRNGRVKIVDTDGGQVLARGGSFDVPVELDWTRDGSRLLVLYRDSMQVVDADGRALWRSKFPPDQTAAGAAFIPGTEAVAALLRGTGPTRRAGSSSRRQGTATSSSAPSSPGPDASGASSPPPTAVS